MVKTKKKAPRRGKNTPAKATQSTSNRSGRATSSNAMSKTNGQAAGAKTNKAQAPKTKTPGRAKSKADTNTVEKFPHFRYYRKNKHPALIVGEQPVEEYRFRKVMHSVKDGERNNEMVYPNPDKKDKEPMYIGKRIRHDKKSSFESKPLPWKYPKKDIKK